MDAACRIEALELTTRIVVAAIERDIISSQQVAGFIGEIQTEMLSAIERSTAEPVLEKQLVPAVNPKKSVSDHFIICLEDGKKFKSLKRHLMTHFGLTPDAYRAKWGLAADYPMVAPNYAAARSQLAKDMGLGKKRAGAVK